MAENGPLLWLDLEMTGLDPEKEGIIEIASLLTDSHLEVIAVGPHIVVHQPEQMLLAMDDWNQEHHRTSGLLDEVRRSNVTVREAERLTLEFVSDYASPRTCPLAGNSIHTDRLFLRYSMPELHDWTHYRIVDVSTIKELVRRWYPELYRQRPNKQGIHRAHDDILESIEELEFYRKQFFVPLA